MWWWFIIRTYMSRLGADVTGIDASEKNIQVAKLHAKKNNLNIKLFMHISRKI